MKQLSGMDNLFLAMEEGNQYMHVAGLGIYDQSTTASGSVRFKQILQFFSARLHTAKVFRRRLLVPPFNIDRPYWMEDGEIDVEYHVRHIALPAPGDWRQLMIQVARIHSRPLDRSRPLWEAYVIEGLDNIPGIAKNSFALYIKFHHAAVDGESGAQIIAAIHSLSNALDDPSTALPEAPEAESDPTKGEQYSRALASRGVQLLDAGKLIARLSKQAGKAGLAMATSGRLQELSERLLQRPGELSEAVLAAASGFKRKPITRFDCPVSPHRVVDAIGVSLDACKAIREHVTDVTINDIFLATCGGAVRRYLEAKGELPESSLSGLMPISTRGESKTADVGNQIAMVPVPLGSDIADPIERLYAVRQGASNALGVSSLLGHDFSGRLIQVIPALAAKQLISRGLSPLCNTTVSNVRGPNVPLYLAGAKLQMFLPVSIAFDGIGLNMTGFSYNGTLWVCFVACRDMLPDPAVFGACLTESFDEILAAARQRSTLLVATKKLKAPVKPRARKTAKS
jgi:WS/DGAT/MGAT family acyltransferase